MACVWWIIRARTKVLRKKNNIKRFIEDCKSPRAKYRSSSVSIVQNILLCNEDNEDNLVNNDNDGGKDNDSKHYDHYLQQWWIGWQ